jgi:predicted nucleic acid-binding protein
LIVVDTNVIAYVLIEGDKTALAQQVAKKDPDWKVPPLWRHEFLNVLATSARAEVIDALQAEALWHKGLDLLVRAEREADGSALLKLAIEHAISAYDAQYIALAQSLETQCITEDKRLLKTFPDTAVSMKAFCT